MASGGDEETNIIDCHIEQFRTEQADVTAQNAEITAEAAEVQAVEAEVHAATANIAGGVNQVNVQQVDTVVQQSGSSNINAENVQVTGTAEIQAEAANIQNVGNLELTQETNITGNSIQELHVEQADIAAQNAQITAEAAEIQAVSAEFNVASANIAGVDEMNVQQAISGGDFRNANFGNKTTSNNTTFNIGMTANELQKIMRGVAGTSSGGIRQSPEVIADNTMTLPGQTNDLDREESIRTRHWSGSNSSDPLITPITSTRVRRTSFFAKHRRKLLFLGVVALVVCGAIAAYCIDQLKNSGGSTAPSSAPSVTTGSAEHYKNCVEACRDVISGAIESFPVGFAAAGADVTISHGDEVYCDCTYGAEEAWTVFHRRLDGSTNFNRSWDAYEKGFGSRKAEFWLGLASLHKLTSDGKYELRVDLKVSETVKAYELYRTFSVRTATSSYQLRVGDSSGTAGDSLSFHNGHPFSTYDHDFTTISCPQQYGAWWFNNCGLAFLNGEYPRSLTWSTWEIGSILGAEMKFRRVN